MAKRRRQGEKKRVGVIKALTVAFRGSMDTIAAAFASDDNLNAMDLLTAQHRYVEKLFAQIAKEDRARKSAAFRELADILAIHAAVEERIFYPAVKSASTEDLLRESAEEHLAMKRTLADLIEMDVASAQFDAKLKVLEEQVSHHAKEEEERKLFPLIRAEQEDDFITALANEMIALMVSLQQRGDARRAVPAETSAASPV
jgi:hemerythrin superfamily protein